MSQQPPMDESPPSLTRSIDIGATIALIIAVWGVLALASAYMAGGFSNRVPFSSLFEWLSWLFAATGPINALGYVLWVGMHYHHELQSDTSTDQLGDSVDA